MTPPDDGDDCGISGPLSRIDLEPYRVLAAERSMAPALTESMKVNKMH